MFGLMLRVFFHFYIVLVIVLIIPSTLSENVIIETEVGSRDKISFPNSTCQVASRMKFCESFGGKEVLHDGKNCSCLCPQDANTFGYDGEYCRCLPNNISYGGCSKFSQINRDVTLQRNSRTKLPFPSKNCSLKVFYRQKNGSWMAVKDITGIITFSHTGMVNGSFMYVLKVSNAIEDFQEKLYNVIVQCEKQNGTCFLLKLPSETECRLNLPVSSTPAPKNLTSPRTNMTITTKNFNSNSALSDGELAAIIVSCLIFLAVLLLLLFLWIRRKRDQAIKDERRESRQQMTGVHDGVKRSSESVIFSQPKRASIQRKDSENLGFEPDAGNSCDDNYEDPDYDLPIDEKHSILSDFINKIKRPLSVKKPIQNQNEKEEKLENETSDEYQIMEKLENPDNLENTAAVYENTNGFGNDEPKPEAKQPSYKKIWRPKLRKKENKPVAQDTRDNKRKINDSDVPQLTVREGEIPKKEDGDKMELDNFYENNEVIKENLRHESASKNPVHETRANYGNDVPEDEEGPPPPPRSTSLEKVLDEPKNRPIPSPRIRRKLQNSQGNDAFNHEIDNQTEDDPSELYENTRKSSNPTPIPRTKR